MDTTPKLATRRILVAAGFLAVAGATASANETAHEHAKPADPHVTSAPAVKSAPAAAAAHGYAADSQKAGVKASAAPSAAGRPDDTGVSPQVALKRLADGNDRFVIQAPQRPNQSQARLCDTFANGQHPFAAVLSCADSRVPPELIFDAGIGDLFVVRVAGNVADVDEVGTLEYGVEHLGINAVLVLGHLKCGAVTAVIDNVHVTPNIEKLVDNIVPAADRARRAFPQLTGPRLVEKAIRQNVHQSIADLTAKSDLLRERVKAGTLTIVGGVYNLHTGEVDWLEQATPTAVGVEPKAPTAKVDVPAKTERAAKPKSSEAGRGRAAPPGEMLRGEGGGHEHPPAAPKAAGHGEAPDGHSEGEPHPAAEEHATKLVGVLAVPAKHVAATTRPATPAEPPAKPENFLALGGLLGGGAAVSYGIIHFMKRR